MSIRSKRFDLVINLAAWRESRAAKRDELFFRIAGIKNRVGFSPVEPGLRQTQGGVREFEAQRLLRRLADSEESPQLRNDAHLIPCSEKALEMANVLLENAGIKGPFLAVSQGTKHDTNDWTQENWAALFGKLAQKLPRATGLVMLGAPDERERSALSAKHWVGPVLNLCGQIPISTSMALLRRAVVFIGHDSGPMHLAAASNTPVVAIFSSRNPPGQWFPLGKGHTVFYQNIECQGCGLEHCVARKKQCILSIQVEDVAQAASARFESKAG